jgi:hypothetical protein
MPGGPEHTGNRSGVSEFQGVENLVFNSFSVGATPFALLQSQSPLFGNQIRP